MAEWVFPNAIAEACKRMAAFNGQHANREYARDPEREKWPVVVRVRLRTLCERTGGLYFHQPGRDSFCGSCGAFVEG